MTIRYFGVAQVIAVHDALVREFGGLHGLRDANLLASAVLRAEMKAEYEPEASAAILAASLSWGLIKNHAFVDGNKRIGLAMLVTFLEANGYTLTALEDEVKAAVQSVAASEMSEGAWTAWVERNVAAHC